MPSADDRSRSKRLLVAALLTLLLPILVSCSSTPKTEQATEEPGPTRIVVGVIKGIQGSDFVVFKRAGSNPALAGEELDWVPRQGGEGGKLRLGAEKRGTLYVADILDGAPQIGDLVYFVETAAERQARLQKAKRDAERIARGRSSSEIDPTSLNPNQSQLPLLPEHLMPGTGTGLGPKTSSTGSVDAGSLPPLRLPPGEERRGSVFDSSQAAPASLPAPAGGVTEVPHIPMGGNNQLPPQVPRSAAPPSTGGAPALPALRPPPD